MERADVVTASPVAMSMGSTRRRARLHEEDDDDNELDEMLVELGIPDSGSKKKTQQLRPAKTGEATVIELITPPRATRRQSSGSSRRQSLVDLTSPQSASPHPSPIASTSTPILAVADSPEPEFSYSYSPSASPPPPAFEFSPPAFEYSPPTPPSQPSQPSSLSFTSPEPEPPVISARRAAFADERSALASEAQRRARRLSGRLHDLHAEIVGHGVSPAQTPQAKKRKRHVQTPPPFTRPMPSPRASSNAAPTTPGRAPTSSVGARSRAATPRATSPAKLAKTMKPGTTVAVLQMERTLDESPAGQSIREALQSHVYNGKKVACRVGDAFDSRLSRVIKWERRRAGSTIGNPSHVSCAVYYEAGEFLRLLLTKSYAELLAAVRELQKLVPPRQIAQEAEEERSKFFVIVEGMDRALIQRRKRQRKAQKATPSNRSDQENAQTAAVSFADLHELAFQLFMDLGTHTQFTCDLEATAEYVALVTRELVIGASPVSAQEEFLEAVPRLHSFRVTHDGVTASVCANAWLRMLQMVPGVSEDKAQSVLDHFPTFDSLLRAYRDPRLSRDEKQDLLSDKLHGERMQRALSKRIFTVFCNEDPSALI